MILKVQVSLATSRAHQQVLAYDRDRKHQWSGDVGDDVLAIMAGRFKAFFHAHVEKATGRLVIDREAADQDW